MRLLRRGFAPPSAQLEVSWDCGPPDSRFQPGFPDGADQAPGRAMTRRRARRGRDRRLRPLVQHQLHLRVLRQHARGRGRADQLHSPVSPSGELTVHNKRGLQTRRGDSLWKSIASELRNWLDKSDTTPDAIGAWPWCGAACVVRSADRAAMGTRARRRRRRRRGVSQSGPAVTHQYLEANLAAKRAALGRLGDPSPTSTRFKPADQLLVFLQNL